jgi:hypothetical protein
MDLVVLHEGRTAAKGSPDEVASSVRERVFLVNDITERDLARLRALGIVSEVHDIGNARVSARFIAPQSPAGYHAEVTTPTLEDAVLYYMHGFS